MSNKKAQKRKADMGYIKRNQREKCANCVAYGKTVMGMPATELQAAVQYVPPHCKLGSFAVDPEAVCDEFKLRLKPQEPQSMNPGLLDGIGPNWNKSPMTNAPRSITEPVKLPRLAAEWGNN
jgi:hypothetical protein